MTTISSDIGTVHPVKIEEEMRSSYLDYAMSVIVSRALPAAQDGLKPVQRRILYAMEEMGVRAGTPYRKSARIVGEVMGKYHPHGDAAIYDAMVRLAQDFSLRYLLIDGQGNFGSVDADPPAAMRYTEARLAPIAAEMLADIDRNTVDMTDNFDGSLQEPVVLPARLPNLLLNGAAGIAVGMATNIPPHNLTELCDAIAHLVDHPEATVDDLCRFVHGPDFPTAGIIHRFRKETEVDEEGKRHEVTRDAIRACYANGHGRIEMRARALIEELPGGRHQIVVSELPYQVNKAALVEKIADLVKDRRIEGISELRDESDRQGMRIVIELKRDAQPRQVLNALYRYTAMQSTFFVNMLALVAGEPKVLSLKVALQQYIRHRQEVITRRSRFDLAKAQERAHILEGLKIALDHLDEVIATIRRSQTVETARQNLMREFKLSQVQAQAILDMQLRRLAALERKRINDEYAEILKTIAYLEDLLANPQKILFLVKEETQTLKTKYGDARRTVVTEQEVTDFKEEDLVPHQEVIITISTRGYTKRVPAATYRSQGRGGRGVTGMVTREDDAVRHLIVADTHDNLLFFTNRGRVFQLKARDITEMARTAKGSPLVNFISIDTKEQTTAVVTLPWQGATANSLVMATALGEVKRTALADFASVRSNGLFAMDLEPEDELVSARLVDATDDIILVTEQAKALRFAVSGLRVASRQSGGVRGIRLAQGDRVVSMDLASSGTHLLIISAQGYGKRAPLGEYPRQGRGSAGVITLKLTQKTGPVAKARVVKGDQEVFLVSAEGIVLRTPANAISAQGRASQGVTVMKIEEQDRVAAIAFLEGPMGPSERPAQVPEGTTKPKPSSPKTKPPAKRS